MSHHICVYICRLMAIPKPLPPFFFLSFQFIIIFFNLKCACFTVVLLIEWPKMQDYLIVLDYICDFISVNEQELKSKHRCFCGMVIKCAPKNAFLQAILLMF